MFVTDMRHASNRLNPEKANSMANPTLTFNPPANATIYHGQFFTITASITGATGLGSGSTIGFGLPAGMEAITANPAPVVSSDGTSGTATLEVIVDVRVASPAQITITPKNITGLPTSSLQYTVKDIQVVVSGPSQGFLPVATDNLQLPTAATYTTLYTATVTEADSGTPVAGFNVDWCEIPDISLFSAKVRPFLKSTDATTAPISYPPGQSYHSYDFEVIRSPTNGSGVSSLYLVSKQNSVSAQLVVKANQFDEQPMPGFIVADIGNPTIATAPMLDPAQIGPDGKLHYEYIDGEDVLVTVPAYHNAADTDTLYLVLNGQVQAPAKKWLEAKAEALDNFSFPKVNGYSDTGPHANDENTLLFVQATATGTANTSAYVTFLGTGDQGENQPPPEHRDLYPATLPGNGKVINSDSILNDITVQVSLNQTNWVGVANDEILAAFYLNAYYEGTDDPHKNVVANLTPYKVSNQDVTNGFATITFSGTSFSGYDHMESPPQTEGSFILVYEITRPTTGVTKYSLPLNGVLDTVAPGNSGGFRKLKLRAKAK